MVNNANFATSITDPRALQSGVIPNARGATCWYSAGYFTVDLDFSDNTVWHRVALYCLDWDTTARAQTIDIIDSANATVLSSQSVSSFNGGQYLIFDVRGHVTIRFTRTGGKDAVLSGLFFDVPIEVPSAPSGLTATAASKSQINLKWNDNSNNETGFKIARATAPGGPFTVIATAGANTTIYNNINLSRNKTYYYMVCATNGGGDSDFSSVASATTLSR